MMSGSDVESRGRARKALGGRAVSALGLAGLCFAFFLPQVQGCEAPARMMSHSLSNARFFMGFLFAFGMLFFYLLRLSVRRERLIRWIAAAACLFTFVMFFYADLYAWEEVYSHTSLTRRSPKDLAMWCGTLLMSAATLGVLAAWAVAPLGLRMPTCVILAGLSSLAYASDYVSRARYGLWVSIGACALMTVGAAWEAWWAWRSHRAEGPGEGGRSP
jgi:hypothetical protein